MTTIKTLNNADLQAIMDKNKIGAEKWSGITDPFLMQQAIDPYIGEYVRVSTDGSSINIVEKTFFNNIIDAYIDTPHLKEEKSKERFKEIRDCGFTNECLTYYYKNFFKIFDEFSIDLNELYVNAYSYIINYIESKYCENEMIRQSMIETLVTNDLKNISEMHESKDYSLLSNILKEGFKPYSEYSNEEITSNFEEIMEIKKLNEEKLQEKSQEKIKQKRKTASILALFDNNISLIYFQFQSFFAR